MKRLFWVVVLVVTVAGLAQVAMAQGVGPDRCLFEWDEPTTNTDGTALTDLKEYRVYVSTVKGTFTTVTATIVAAKPNPVVGSVGRWDCKVAGLTAGQKYLTVRAVDLAGNESANGQPPPGATWTAADGLPFVYDIVRPNAVGGLRIMP